MQSTEGKQFKFQVPPDNANRESLIGALEYWVLRAKKAEAVVNAAKKVIACRHVTCVNATAYQEAVAELEKSL